MGQVRAAVEAARKAGFQNLSLDLIYGLPGQALSQLAGSRLSAAVDLEPEHLTLLWIEGGGGDPPLCPAGRAQTCRTMTPRQRCTSTLWNSWLSMGYRPV